MSEPSDFPLILRAAHAEHISTDSSYVEDMKQDLKPCYCTVGGQTRFWIRYSVSVCQCEIFDHLDICFPEST